MSTIVELPFFAGVDRNEQPVFESLKVEVLDEGARRVRLMHSPAFVRNLAAGDHIKVINPATAEYELEKRSGNLCIRVLRMNNIQAVADQLVPALEKLGGALDVQTDRSLIFSVHFSIGFARIEALLNAACEQYPDTVWYYGNVYDPNDGTTPLLWWQDFENLENL